MESSTDTKRVNYLAVIQYTVYGSVVLYFGKELFVPISLAILISFIVYPVSAWMERRGIGRMISILICVLIVGLMILGIIALLVTQFLTFTQEWPLISDKLTNSVKELSQFIIDSYGITRDQQARWLSQLASQSATNAVSVLRSAIVTSTLSAVLLILVPVYSVLILYYRRQWLAVLYTFLPDNKRDQVREVLSMSIVAYHDFIKGMALVYLLVGVLNSLGLLLLGVPHAILFGFIAAILTFIPYVGIIIGSLLPITMAWVTYDSPWYPLGVVAIFTLVQYLEANLIFPLAVSKKLHVNTLVVLVAIFVGGILWGVVGMILFVPFVAILKLIADHNPRLKMLSMILGTGKIYAQQNRKI